jgi:tRNA-splicing ligase RtcB (3'-phosphate/5'-hydroxy nucleic acid ligase)
VNDQNYEVFTGHPDQRVPVKAWTKFVEFEDQAKAQVLNLAGMPFVHSHIAVMPDVHAGIGATVGSVIATRGAIIPAAVGVDIGCGMCAVKTSLNARDLPDSLAEMRLRIEEAVPHGRTDNGGANDKGGWGSNVPDDVYSCWRRRFMDEYANITEKHPGIVSRNNVSHLGTLGTGNHFVEVCLDKNQDVWVMLHSGSRGLGNRFGSYFIELAKKDMERYFINLPDQDLAYLPEGSKYYDDYLNAVTFAQEFARSNRDLMLTRTLDAIQSVMGDKKVECLCGAVNCHHNYVSKEYHFGKEVLVTRKGAVSAKKGELGIIPGSMGARSFIVRGKGNPQSFCSCSHGAGRKMSRTEAKRTFTLEDHAKATAGVECRKDEDVIDETPGAYKSIENVMASQADLVDVEAELKQVLCVKG